MRTEFRGFGKRVIDEGWRSFEHGRPRSPANHLAGFSTGHRLAVRAFTSGNAGSGALGTGSYQKVAQDQSS